jgi:diguanylate cyclase (GGDEF)-like protein
VGVLRVTNRPVDRAEADAVDGTIARNVLSLLPLSLLADVGAGSLLSFAVTSPRHVALSALWTALLALYAIPMLLAMRQAKRATAEGRPIRLGALVVGNAFTSTVWGALPLLVEPDGSVPTLTWQILAGGLSLTFAGTVAFAGNRRLLLAWVLPMWVGNGVWAATGVLEQAWWMVLFIPFALAAAVTMHHVASSFLVDAALEGHRNRVLLDALEASRAALAHDATHDRLTGLPNRAAMHEHLERSRQACVRYGTTLGLVFIDLDGFKPVNDRHGHAAGDELLVAVGQRLRRITRSGDFVGRIGGDEFVAVAGNLVDATVVAELAERIRAVLAEPFELSVGTIRIGASVGTAWAAGPGLQPDVLLRAADADMYRQKPAARRVSPGG